MQMDTHTHAHTQLGKLYLTPDKIHFKPKTNKRQKRSLYNDKDINSLMKCNICKYVCTQHRSNYICVVTINRSKGRNSSIVMEGDCNTAL